MIRQIFRLLPQCSQAWLKTHVALAALVKQQACVVS